MMVQSLRVGIFSKDHLLRQLLQLQVVRRGTNFSARRHMASGKWSGINVDLAQDHTQSTMLQMGQFCGQRLKPKSMALSQTEPAI